MPPAKGGTNVRHKCWAQGFSVTVYSQGHTPYPNPPLTRAPLGRSVMLPSVALLSCAERGRAVWLSPLLLVASGVLLPSKCPLTPSVTLPHVNLDMITGARADSTMLLPSFAVSQSLNPPIRLDTIYCTSLGAQLYGTKGIMGTNAGLHNA